MQRYACFTTVNHEHEQKSVVVSLNCPKENTINNKSGKFPFSGVGK
jgi:hypothetical protein